MRNIPYCSKLATIGKNIASIESSESADFFASFIFKFLRPAPTPARIVYARKEARWPKNRLFARHIFTVSARLPARKKKLKYLEWRPIPWLADLLWIIIENTIFLFFPLFHVQPSIIVMCVYNLCCVLSLKQHSCKRWWTTQSSTERSKMLPAKAPTSNLLLIYIKLKSRNKKFNLFVSV